MLRKQERILELEFIPVQWDNLEFFNFFSKFGKIQNGYFLPSKEVLRGEKEFDSVRRAIIIYERQEGAERVLDLAKKSQLGFGMTARKRVDSMGVGDDSGHSGGFKRGREPPGALRGHFGADFGRYPEEIIGRDLGVGGRDFGGEGLRSARGMRESRKGAKFTIDRPYRPQEKISSVRHDFEHLASSGQGKQPGAFSEGRRDYPPPPEYPRRPKNSKIQPKKFRSERPERSLYPPPDGQFEGNSAHYGREGYRARLKQPKKAYRGLEFFYEDELEMDKNRYYSEQESDDLAYGGPGDEIEGLDEPLGAEKYPKVYGEAEQKRGLFHKKFEPQRVRMRQEDDIAQAEHLGGVFEIGYGPEIAEKAYISQYPFNQQKEGNTGWKASQSERSEHLKASDQLQNPRISSNEVSEAQNWPGGNRLFQDLQVPKNDENGLNSPEYHRQAAQNAQNHPTGRVGPLSKTSNFGRFGTLNMDSKPTLSKYCFNSSHKQHIKSNMRLNKTSWQNF